MTQLGTGLRWGLGLLVAVGLMRIPCVTFSGLLVYLRAQRVAELAATKRLPAMYAFREVPQAGGLVSYGPNLLDMVRQSARYVDRSLKGAEPADLPVEQPTSSSWS